MPKNPVVIKTIVTTDMVIPLAKKYGVEVIDVLTGFKFIGEQIGLLEQKGEEYRYIFGFEESYGYLSGTYVRDKDAVNASLLICEMAAYYKADGITLMDALEDLHRTYGYYVTSLATFDFHGISGFKKMQTIMANLREGFIKDINGKKVIEKYDYKLSIKHDCDGHQEKIELPKSDVIKFILDGNSSVVVRPSGTEPKLKIYYSSQGKSKDEANKNIQDLQSYFCEFINKE
jgi:phosphoglucomutase